MCRTGRCFLRQPNAVDIDPQPLEWDDAGPWRFHLNVEHNESAGTFALQGAFERGSERMPLSAPRMVLQGGHLFLNHRVAELDDAGAFEWIVALRKKPLVKVPAAEADELLAELYA